MLHNAMPTVTSLWLYPRRILLLASMIELQYWRGDKPVFYEYRLHQGSTLSPLFALVMHELTRHIGMVMLFTDDIVLVALK